MGTQTIRRASKDKATGTKDMVTKRFVVYTSAGCQDICMISGRLFSGCLDIGI